VGKALTAGIAASVTCPGMYCGCSKPVAHLGIADKLDATCDMFFKCAVVVYTGTKIECLGAGKHDRRCGQLGPTSPVVGATKSITGGAVCW